MQDDDRNDRVFDDARKSVLRKRPGSSQAATNSNKVRHIQEVIDVDKDQVSLTVSPITSGGEEEVPKDVGRREEKEKGAGMKESKGEGGKAKEKDKKKEAPVSRKAYEVFCGKAELTKRLKKAGFDAIGIDWKGNKDKPVSQVLLLDIDSDWGAQRLREGFSRQRW